MKTKPGTLFIDEAEPVVTRQVVGDDVLLFCRGVVVASIRRSDPLSRDVAIIALFRLGRGLVTDRIAELCGASHGWVCKVRERFRRGGMAAALSRGKPGPGRSLTGRAEERLKELHAEGKSQAVIASKLGVSKSLIAKEIKRLGLPRRGSGTQHPLPGVGRGRRPPQLGPSMPVEPDTVSAEAMGGGGPQPAPVEPLEVEAIRSTEVGVGSESEQNTSADVHIDTATPVDSSVPEASEPLAMEDTIEVEATVEAIEEVSAESESVELQPGAQLRSGPTEHVCRYAGMLLLCAASAAIGVPKAIVAANVVRPETSVYSAHQVLLALMAAWGAGYGSLESMHERDAASLGVVLGLERSPSVRTLHRAIAQMGAVFDPSMLTAELMRGVLLARLPERFWFGADGHFKAYSGAAPIDKGRDTKRRIVSKGIADVVLTDDRGWTWGTYPVNTGDALSKHLLTKARALRGVIGDARPIVMAFDRGGFDFDVLDALDLEGFGYAGYVPWSVSLPDLSEIAPARGGVGEVLWTHPRLHHKARLLVERDGDALIPVVTNLPTLVDAVEVLNELRVRRGAQENAFKAARAFVNIDALVDRGGVTFGPDNRPVYNPARATLKKEAQALEERRDALKEERAEPGVRSRSDINHDRFWADVEQNRIRNDLRTTPAKVPRVAIEPNAKRAVLKSRHRLLLQPLKYAAENARRWLLGTLAAALAPTDHGYDDGAVSRTLLALLRAPGSIRFDDDVVHVTLEFPLPPTAHHRIAAALEQLDKNALPFTDAHRRIRFRLAPRPTRDTVYGGAAEMP